MCVLKKLECLITNICLSAYHLGKKKNITNIPLQYCLIFATKRNHHFKTWNTRCCNSYKQFMKKKVKETEVQILFFKRTSDFHHNIVKIPSVKINFFKKALSKLTKCQSFHSAFLLYLVKIWHSTISNSSWGAIVTSSDHKIKSIQNTLRQNSLVDFSVNPKVHVSHYLKNAFHLFLLLCIIIIFKKEVFLKWRKKFLVPIPLLIIMYM